MNLEDKLWNSVWDSVEISVGVSGHGLVGSKLKEYELGTNQ